MRIRFPFFLMVSFLMVLAPLPARVAERPALAGDYATVKRVVDGDTVILTDGQKVRLIGIDTPESRRNGKLARDMEKTRQDADTIIALGKRSAQFTRSLTEGKRVRLEYDVEKRDRYGRTLAYLYTEDGMFVNAEILREGYAMVLTVPPNVKHKDLFVKLQKEAREAKRGLWRETPILQAKSRG
jgi:micrococcal nuclease